MFRTTFSLFFICLGLPLAAQLLKESAPTTPAEPVSEPVASTDATTTLAPPPAAPAPNLYDAVLRIEVSTQEPDYKTPWNPGRFGGGIGTGFIIGPNQILTNAHVVSNARRILVTTHNNSRKHPARVVHIAHDCDLALLELDDFTPFLSAPVLKFGSMPALESTVRAIGYPVGGQRISVTSGVVSRIDFRPYSHSRADSHLVIQIDAAINPGNSGGPVLQNNKVVGVAFQGLTQADNTGYIIPNPVISRFLQDIADGQYDEYADLGISSFGLHNPAMRQALMLPQDHPGVYISYIIPDGPCDGQLKKGDVLTKIDDYTIDRSGNIDVDGQRINLNEIVERKQNNETISLEVLRPNETGEGETIQATVTLQPGKFGKMFANQYDKRPRYVFCAGITFQPLDRNLYSAHRFSSARTRNIYTNYITDGIFQKREDVVMITRIESDQLTTYFSGFAGTIVDSINDEPINTLQELHDILYGENAPEYFVIRLNGIKRPIIIPSKEIATANERMMANYGITSLSYLKKK